MGVRLVGGNEAGAETSGIGARSEDGSAIAKGTEIMVTRYERGIAYVRVWDDPERAGATD